MEKNEGDRLDYIVLSQAGAVIGNRKSSAKDQAGLHSFL
jgi:hypothetical protein